MRRRRSTTCRYCWNSGHTRRTCPELKRNATNGDENAKWMIENMKPSTRSCSYCRETGHTRRGCTDFVKEKATFDSVNKAWANQVKMDMKNAGVSVGSLMLIPYREYDNGNEVLVYVQKVNVDNRFPTGDWLKNYRDSNPSMQTELDGYYRYQSVVYGTRPKRRQLGMLRDATIHFRSVSGTGLGYWQEDSTTESSWDHLISNRFRYKAVG